MGHEFFLVLFACVLHQLGRNPRSPRAQLKALFFS